MSGYAVRSGASVRAEAGRSDRAPAAEGGLRHLRACGGCAGTGFARSVSVVKEDGDVILILSFTEGGDDAGMHPRLRAEAPCSGLRWPL